MMILLQCRFAGNFLTCCHRYSIRLFTKKLTQKENVMRILNVAEKNDAAKNIANFLSRGSSYKREGLSKYNKIYEFNFTFNEQQSRMVMTSVSGHLLTYEFTGQHRKWLSCSPEELFDAPVVKICPENYQQIQNTIRREVRTCDILIIWTDCDREGENIGFEVINVCRSIKPNIPVYRAKFSEITMQSVHNAMNRLEQPNKLVSDAVDVRSELDLRIGAAFTRFQTLRLKRVFPDVLGDRIISYGSCQFPTMGFVVQRYKEVQDFKAETFWKLKVTHALNDLTVEFLWKRVRLFDKVCCQVLHERCKDEPLARVESVETKSKSKWRPVALDTIELEKAANRYLKLSAKETMKIAERLYSQGYISYPRTETNIFPKNMDLTALVRAHVNDNRWGQFVSKVLQDGVTPRQGKKSDQAHPPIHPIKYTDGLNGNERKVYEFIVRRFLACVSKDAEGFETIVKIDVHDEKFIGSGLQIVALNYLEVYPYEKWTTKEIHLYREGQTFTPTSIDMVEGETTPPNLLTEAELIALMDKHGIGTDATHAEHIDKIQERMYVGLIDERYFTPGKLGIGLVDGYDNMGFEMSKPYLRAELENDLKKICEGLADPKVVLREQINKYREVFKKSVEQANKLDLALAKYLESQPETIENNINAIAQSLPEFVQKCSACGAGMVLRRREARPSFISCTTFPSCRNAIWLPEKVIEVELTTNSCPQCGPDVRLLKFKFRSNSMTPFYPDVYTGCIGGCDDQFLERLDVQQSARRDAGDVVTSNSVVTRPPIPAHSNNSSFESGYQSNQRFSGTPNESFDSQGNNRQWGPSNSDFRAGSFSSNGSSSNHCGTNSSDRNQWGNIPTAQGPNQWNSQFRNTNTSSNNQWSGNTGNTNTLPSNQWNNNPGRFNASGSSQWGNNSGSIGETENKQCNCGLPVRRFTVQKETANKGRAFYGCSKAMGDSGRCQFFLWADAGPPPPATNTQQPYGSNPPFSNYGSGLNSFGNQNRFRNTNTSFRAKKKTNPNRTTTGSGRKCGNCRQEGHTRNNCPLNEDSQ